MEKPGVRFHNECARATKKWLKDEAKRLDVPNFVKSVKFNYSVKIPGVSKVSCGVTDVNGRQIVIVARKQEDGNITYYIPYEPLGFAIPNSVIDELCVRTKETLNRRIELFGS